MAWAIDHFGWLAAGAGASLAVSLGGLLAVRWVVISLPSDYFVAKQATNEWRCQHPLVRWSWFALKNVMGVLLLAAGVTMLVTPGPGVLAILLGLSLVTVPGKRRLVHAILRNPHVLSALNLLRSRARQPALIVPSANRQPVRHEES